MATKQQLLNRILSRLRKMQAELEQTIRDKEWWNDNRTDAEPFDIGWNRVILRYVNLQLEAWGRGDVASATKWNIKMHEWAMQHERAINGNS